MIRKILGKLMDRISINLNEIDQEQAKNFCSRVMRSKRIFVAGTGRSGQVAGAFAMRLMHLGFNTFVVGEITTPPIRKRDLLICVTGSGETRSMVSVAETAVEKKAVVFAITSNRKSSVGKLAGKNLVEIKGRKGDFGGRDYGSRQLMGIHEPITPMGTLFEISAMMFLDAIVAWIMIIQNKDEDELKMLHTNLE